MGKKTSKCALFELIKVITQSIPNASAIAREVASLLCPFIMNHKMMTQSEFQKHFTDNDLSNTIWSRVNSQVVDPISRIGLWGDHKILESRKSKILKKRKNKKKKKKKKKAESAS